MAYLNKFKAHAKSVGISLAKKQKQKAWFLFNKKDEDEFAEWRRCEKNIGIKAYIIHLRPRTDI